MNEYLTITQVISRLHSSRTTVARWCRDGLLAGAVKPGHDWLIPAGALDGFTPPTPGPKPAGDRKRLLEQAKEEQA